MSNPHDALARVKMFLTGTHNIDTPSSLEERIDLALKTVNGALESARPEVGPRWIPVAERLPEHVYPQTHLVWNDRDGIDLTTVHPSWWNKPDPRGPEHDGPTVTHWMPLPDAPNMNLGKE